MLKTTKLHLPDNEVLFVSDLHWGHDKPFLWAKRGYASAKEHNDGVIHQWNSICTNRSHCFHLGDLVFNDPDALQFADLIRRLSFDTLYLHWGNHNSGVKKVYVDELARQHPGLDGEVYPLRYQPIPGKTVVFLPEYSEAFINGQHIIMCHYPIISHNRVGHRSWMLAGHSHGSCAFTNKDTASGLRLDVGIESFGRPVTFAELKKRFDGREVVSFDHHDKTTS